MTTDEIIRFDRTERTVHWVTAILGLTLVATGAALYAGPLSTLVGRRDLMKTVHVVAGLALPVPVIVALLMPRAGRAFRADLRALDRFDADDRRWFRRTHPRWYEEVTGQSAARLATSPPGPKAGSAAARPR